MSSSAALCGPHNPAKQLTQTLANHGSSAASGSRTHTTTPQTHERFRSIEDGAPSSQALDTFGRETAAEILRMAEQPPRMATAPSVVGPHVPAPQRAQHPSAATTAQPKAMTVEDAWDTAFASVESDAQAEQTPHSGSTSGTDDVSVQQSPQSEPASRPSSSSFNPERFGFVHNDMLIDRVGDRVTLFHNGCMFEVGRGDSVEFSGEPSFKIEVDEDGRCNARIAGAQVIENNVPAQFVRPVTVVAGETDISSRFRPTADEVTTAREFAQQGGFQCDAGKLVRLLSSIQGDAAKLNALRALRDGVALDKLSDVLLILDAFSKDAQPKAIRALFPPAIRAKL